jgi:hypothetical protein
MKLIGNKNPYPKLRLKTKQLMGDHEHEYFFKGEDF